MVNTQNPLTENQFKVRYPNDQVLPGVNLALTRYDKDTYLHWKLTNGVWEHYDTTNSQGDKV